MRTQVEQQANTIAIDSQKTIDGVVVGRIAGFDSAGSPLVTHDHGSVLAPLPARSACTLPEDAVGHEAAIMFEAGDPERPIIMGLMHQPSATKAGSDNKEALPPETLTLNAKDRITLRCGKASITLTKQGKVLVRGAYLLSRSSGPNRIKGGSVQIN